MIAPRAALRAAAMGALAACAATPALAQQPPVAPVTAADSAAADSAAADSAAAASRQEALVLSGGGSRGLAHAGVFLGLEELGYDPDIVVGTSMGAVLGALYASGEPPERIRDRIRGVGWSGLFSPTPTVLGPSRTLYYPLVNFDLDLGPLRFSRGLLGQWRINEALARLLFDANARIRGDFDRLPRRFRAVAADLETGEVVVLDSGDLARAARASMAVPGLFAPVEWDGRTLVDGGIADNLPTSVARELGAERIVAVDVSPVPPEIHSRAPLAVVSRVLDLMQRTTRRDTLPPDALILPAIEPGFQATTFPDDPAPLIRLGLEATLEALPPAGASGGAGPADPDRTAPPPPETFGRLEIDAPDAALEALARRAFRDVVGAPYDPEAVLEAMDRLYTTGLFEAVWPSVVDAPDPGAAPTLRVRLTAPPGLSLSAGAGFENDRGGRAWATLERSTAVAGRPTVLEAAAALNGLDRWGALSARLYMIGRPAVAWTGGGHVRERRIRTFLDDVRVTLDAVRAGGWLGVELPHLLRDRLVSATVLGEWVDIEDGAAGGSFGPLIRFASVRPEPPVVGEPFLAEAEHRIGAFGYSRVALRGSRDARVGPLLTAALVDLRAVTPDAPDDIRPALGDEHAVPGLRWGEGRGQARAVAGLDVAYPVGNAFARLQLRAGAAPVVLEDWRATRVVAGARLGGFWSSPVGVVELGYGVATTGDGRVRLSIGRQF